MASGRRGDGEGGAAVLAPCPPSAKPSLVQTEVSHNRASAEIRPSLGARSIFPERISARRAICLAAVRGHERVRTSFRSKTKRVWEGGAVGNIAPKEGKKKRINQLPK